jgi:hypothetical protein
MPLQFASGDAGDYISLASTPVMNIGPVGYRDIYGFDRNPFSFDKLEQNASRLAAKGRAERDRDAEAANHARYPEPLPARMYVQFFAATGAGLKRDRKQERGREYNHASRRTAVRRDRIGYFLCFIHPVALFGKLNHIEGLARIIFHFSLFIYHLPETAARSTKMLRLAM